MHRIVILLVLVLVVDLRAADKSKPTGAPKPAKSDGAIALFDGKSLAGWKNSDFAANGGGSVDTGFKGGPVLIVDQGEVLSGITYTNPVPKADYEISLAAMKLSGSDFMCGLTFPVKDTHATLVLGGWGGGVVGISSID